MKASKRIWLLMVECYKVIFFQPTTPLLLFQPVFFVLIFAAPAQHTAPQLLPQYKAPAKALPVKKQILLPILFP